MFVLTARGELVNLEAFGRVRMESFDDVDDGYFVAARLAAGAASVELFRGSQDQAQKVMTRIACGLRKHAGLCNVLDGKEQFGGGRPSRDAKPAPAVEPPPVPVGGGVGLRGLEAFRAAERVAGRLGGPELADPDGGRRGD